METLETSVGVIVLLSFVLLNIVGTWYFVRVTNVDPRFPLPEFSKGGRGVFERALVAIDCLSLLYLPAFLFGLRIGIEETGNDPGLRNFVYAWLISRIVAPVIAPEEDVPADIGFFGYIKRRYEEFGRSLFVLPIMYILVFGVIGWVISNILELISLREYYQSVFELLLPIAGFPVLFEDMSSKPSLTPIPAAALFAFAFILVARLAPLWRSHLIPQWKIFACLVAGVCLLGRTQLYSGIDFSTWPTWPTTAEFVVACVSVVLGTIPPLAIAFFTRKPQSFAKA